MGESATDKFIYTLSDGTTTTTAELTITVLGANDAPVAADDYGAINENATLTVADGDNQYFTANQRYDDTGEHSGDVINTTYTGTDTDVDGDTLTVSAVRTGGTEDAGTAGTVGSALTGTYGQLTLNSNGSYTYVANQAAAEALDVGDTVTDSFNYTVTDGALTDTAVIEIKVFGRNDVPDAQNDTGVVNEDATLTVANGDNATAVTSVSLVRTVNITSQETYPRDVTFNNDGTKMFVIGANGDAVDEWTLSTAYDTSTLSYVGNFSISSKDSLPWGVSFNNDGTKMFVSGDSSNGIHEYNLSTAFTVSSASFDSTFSLSSQDSQPAGHAFNNDGTKLFVVGRNGNDVSEYTLSTGFDISTASYVDSFSVSSQETDPRNIEFNLDGTKMFLIGSSSESINEYDLSTGFDVSTATYHGAASIGENAGIAFNSSGTKVYIAQGGGTGVVKEYDLVSPFHVVDINGEHTGDVIDTTSASNKDSDADASASLSVSQIKKNGGSNSAVSSGSSYNSNGTSVTGTYGTLTIGADGSYTYAATADAADGIATGETETDVFVYTLTDGTDTTTANITITIIGVNDSPTAQNDEGVIMEGNTLTVANGSNANVSGSYDATGEHSGDVLDTTSSSHKDSDPDTSDTLTITYIKKDGGSNSAVSSGSSYNSSGTAVTGAYGTLTIGADGSYKYVAQSDISGFDAGETLTDTFTYTCLLYTSPSPRDRG